MKSFHNSFFMFYKLAAKLLMVYKYLSKYIIAHDSVKLRITDLCAANSQSRQLFNLTKTYILSISLLPIMMLAQHLAILNIRRTTLAPGRHMVGVHLFELPNLVFIEAIFIRTVGAIAMSGSFCQ